MTNKISIYIEAGYKGLFFNDDRPEFLYTGLPDHFEIFSDRTPNGGYYMEDRIYRIVDNRAKVTEYLYYSKEHRLGVVDMNNFYDFLCLAPRSVFSDLSDMEVYLQCHKNNLRKDCIYKIKGYDSIYLYNGNYFIKIYKYLNPKLYVGRCTLKYGSIFEQYKAIVGNKEFDKCSIMLDKVWAKINDRPDFNQNIYIDIPDNSNLPLEAEDNEDSDILPPPPDGFEIQPDYNPPVFDRALFGGLGIIVGLIIGFALKWLGVV